MPPPPVISPPAVDRTSRGRGSNDIYDAESILRDCSLIEPDRHMKNESPSANLINFVVAYLSFNGKDATKYCMVLLLSALHIWLYSFDNN